MPTATKYFTVAAPQGMSAIKLDSKGCATCQITVKNVSRAPIDGRAILVSLAVTKPALGPVEKGWVTVDGLTDRHFEVDQEQVFSVKVAVPPPKKGEAAPAGNYSFRIDVINVARPDDSADQSQALGFTVAASAPKTPSKWPWIALAAALVLLVGGVTTWLLWPKPAPTTGNLVPDVTGKTTTDAYTILANAKFILDQNFDHADSTPENSGKIVSQNPAAGTKADPGSTVKVALGTPMVAMPSLVGHTFAEAQSIANQSSLGAITSTTQSNPSYSSKGVVWSQTPDAGASVKTGTAISVKITPQDIPVVRVIGMPFSEASGVLQRAGLSVGQVQGYAPVPTLPVTAQSPGAGSMVAVGTPVNLVLQCPWPPTGIFAPFAARCSQVIQRPAVQQMFVDKAVATRILVK